MKKQGDGSLIAAERNTALSPEARRALKVTGIGATVGVAMGAAVGGSIGIAALGSAVGVPLIVAGAALGAGIASIWDLFLGGRSRERTRLIQKELAELQADNRVLRAQLRSAHQDIVNASSEIDRLNADVSTLHATLEKVRPTHVSGGATSERIDPHSKYWVGVTTTGGIMVFDPDCQMSSGQLVMLFLPSIGDYRIFRKESVRHRLSKISDTKSIVYIQAYVEWLSLPANLDLQKNAIHRLVERQTKNR